MNFPLTKKPKTPYQIEYEDNLIRSTTEDGYEITRPRYTKQRKRIVLKWDIVNSEYTTINNFYTTSTLFGSLPFNLTFSTSDSTPNSAITFSSTVRFASPPKMTYAGIGVWELECSFREV